MVVERARVIVTFLGEEADGAALRRAAGLRLLDDMKRGLYFGGGKLDRGALYDERVRELDRRRARDA